MNILVGNNEAGKSTILEAIHLALTGILNGRYLKNELSQYLFNRDIEQKYINSLKEANPLKPPCIRIELFLTDNKNAALAAFRGNMNNEHLDSCGISFCIEFDDHYNKEYSELIKQGKIKTIPIEYYKVSWRSFARDAVTARSIPIKSALIDSASTRLQNGSDVYISRIIRENLEDKEKVEISQAHRHMKESFMENPSVIAINEKINKDAQITSKKVKISVDLSTQNAWEMSLMTYLDEIPFHYIGKGEQNIIKTNLALSHKKSEQANIILLEEPENHLSHTKLNELMKKIISKLENKQIIISTHCSFVANKLGLNNLILLNNSKNIRLNQLSAKTKIFFEKLSGYDTLRLILCTKSILVEGDSDELIVQKAYRSLNQDMLPIENGIDVISVGTAFLRFLEIAEKIGKVVVVITDNDGDLVKLERKYKKYIQNKSGNIKICYSPVCESGNIQNFNYNTLEPSMLYANNRNELNDIFGTSYQVDNDLLRYMKKNKTLCALKIFDTSKTITFPKYIVDGITWLTSS